MKANQLPHKWAGNPVVGPSSSIRFIVAQSEMAGADGDDSLYPIAVLIDELRNEDVQVGGERFLSPCC